MPVNSRWSCVKTGLRPGQLLTGTGPPSQRWSRRARKNSSRTDTGSKRRGWSDWNAQHEACRWAVLKPDFPNCPPVGTAASPGPHPLLITARPSVPDAHGTEGRAVDRAVFDAGSAGPRLTQLPGVYTQAG